MRGLLLSIISFLFLAGPAWGATYNIGPGQTYETFTALVAAQNLAADDIVDGGGNTFTETWTLDGGGTDGHVVTLRNATIDGQSTRAYGIDTNGKHYITISNISTTNHTTAGAHINASNYVTIDTYASSGVGRSVRVSGSSDHPTLSNITSTSTGTASGGAIDIEDGATNISISTVTITGYLLRGIYSKATTGPIGGSTITVGSIGGQGVDSVTPGTWDDVQLTGCAENAFYQHGTTGNLVLSNIYIGVTRAGVATANAKTGIIIATHTGDVTMTAIKSSNNVRWGVYLGTGITGLFTGSGWEIENNGYSGVFVTTNTFSVGSSLSDFMVTGNGTGGALGTYHGISVIDTPNLTLSNGESNSNVSSGYDFQGSATTGLTVILCDADDNGDDGFDLTDAVPDAVFDRVRGLRNGTAGTGVTPGSGDGWSAHDTCTATITYSIFADNLNTGIANGTGANSGTIENCVLWNNGSDDATMNRSNLYLANNGGTGWTVKNSIIGQGYRCELFESATPNNVYANNIWYPKDDAKFYSTDMVSFTSWADIGAGYKTDSLNTDPGFVSAAAGDFRLRGSSPARDAGTNPCTASGVPLACCTGSGTDDGTCTDYAGRHVPMGLGWDIGAYEYYPPAASLRLLKLGF